MFCPKCRYEYKEGVTQCPDCGTPLVAELPPEPDHKGIELVTVLETSDRWKIGVAKNMLGEAGINFITKGYGGVTEIFGGADLGSVPSARPVEIQVNPEDEQKALDILGDLTAEES